MLRVVATVAGAAGAGTGFLFIVLTVPAGASGWATWPGRLALVGLGATCVVGMAGALAAWRHPAVGAAMLAFAGAALILLPIFTSALLFGAALLCVATVSWRPRPPRGARGQRSSR